MSVRSLQLSLGKAIIEIMSKRLATTLHVQSVISKTLLFSYIVTIAEER